MPPPYQLPDPALLDRASHLGRVRFASHQDLPISGSSPAGAVTSARFGLSGFPASDADEGGVVGSGMVAAAPALVFPPRYVVTPPGDTRPSLLVQLCPEVNDNVLNELRQAMFNDGCANGIAVDPRRFVVLRDTYLSRSPSSIEEDFVLDTPMLLPGSTDLELRLNRWLDLLTRNWQEAIPHERWAAPLLADIVPAAAGAAIRRSFRGGSR